MAVEIHSGDLRYKLVFKRPVSSLNDEGGEERSFEEAFTTFGAIRKPDYRRVTEANQTNITETLDFFVRKSEDRLEVDKDWLIEYNSHDYVIHETEPVDYGGRHKLLRFTGRSKGPAISVPMSCAGMLNFTDFTYNEDTNLLTFTGGNLLGITEVEIEGVTEAVLPQGTNSFTVQLESGVYGIQWRKKCGQTYTDHEVGTLTVNNAGPVTMRLYPVEGTVDDETELFDFPLDVANDIPETGGEHAFNNIGQADDAEEYMDLWNADSFNQELGQITGYEFVTVGAESYWQFDFTPNDNVPLPDNFRGFPL